MYNSETRLLIRRFESVLQPLFVGFQADASVKPERPSLGAFPTNCHARAYSPVIRCALVSAKPTTLRQAASSRDLRDLQALG